MDFINGRIKPLYFRFLAAAFGSAMITSVYSVVDMAMPITEVAVAAYAGIQMRRDTRALPAA